MRRIFSFCKNWISQNKILTLILMFAAILRFGGVYPGYPPTHPDETAIYSTAIKMIRKVTYDPMRYDYAALPMIIHTILYITITPFFSVYSFIFAPENLPRFKNALDFFQQITWRNSQTAVLYWGRFITAFFGIGVVFMVYQVAIKFFNRKTIGLTAAFLTAVNFRQVLNSRIILPDIYNAFFLLVCFYTFSNLLKKPNRRNYLIGGIALGMYLSVKFHVFALLSFITIHLINTWVLIKKHDLENILKNRNVLLNHLFRIDFMFASLLIIIVFVTINPYLFLHFQEFLATSDYQARQYRVGINNLDLYSLSYLYHIGIGGAVSVFVLMGIVLGLRKYIISTILLLATIIPFFYFLAYYGNGGFYTRNFVTIIPLLLVFAGLSLVEICLVFGKKLKLKKHVLSVLGVMLVLAISWEPINNSITNVYFFSKPTNYLTANLWVQNNIPTGSVVAIRTSDKFPNKKQFKKVNFEYNDTFSLAEMQEAGVDYGYIALDELNLFFYWWMKEPTSEALKYWNKRNADNISQNTFTAKVAQELSSWAIAAFIKPWQAPDVNYLIVKIPNKFELTQKKIIREFSFDKKNNLSSWFLINGYNETVNNIAVDPLVGKLKTGAIRIDRMGAWPNVIRAVSPIIPLEDKNNRAYEITGWMKAGAKLDRKEKDGYMIVDFYKENPQKISLTTKSFSSAVSSRIFDTTDWVFKRITVVVPKGAKFMTVSLGVSGPTTFWFDDITIAQSDNIFEDPRVSAPYLNYYEIPENILFPVSHGNL